MEARNGIAGGTRRAVWARRCFFVFPAVFAASLLLLGFVVVSWPPPSPPPPTPGIRLPNNALFARGHAAADARTLVAMLRYLITPEGRISGVAQIAATNQVPVNG